VVTVVTGILQAFTHEVVDTDTRSTKEFLIIFLSDVLRESRNFKNRKQCFATCFYAGIVGNVNLLNKSWRDVS
jgi:hypothetical protein